MTKQELRLLLISKRKELGLSQQDVVEKTGYIITRQHYSMIEKGERRPSVDVAKELSVVLGVEWTIFFEVESNQKLRDSSITA